MGTETVWRLPRRRDGNNRAGRGNRRQRMKINITMETTPAELREFLGLPEVQSLQAEMIEKIREQMQAGVEGFDPVSMMRPFITPNIESMEAMQRAFWKGLSAVATTATGDRKREG
jgi:hypothetical protein